MGYYCNPCGRDFTSERALEQHLDHSEAHRYVDDPSFECDYCDECFSSSKGRGDHLVTDHPWCASCKRMFRNMNNLRQHLHSSVHVGRQISCPWCNENMTTASGATIHLESGRCTASGLDRQKINNLVQRLDPNHVITKPMIGYYNNSISDLIATEASWNGDYYECYLCHRDFGSLTSLNQHLKSPAHEQSIFRCPKGTCRREYKLLSGLIQHFESESCGVMRFRQVQQGATAGIQNMIGRMIQR